MNKNSFLLPLRHTVFLMLLILKYILKLLYRAGNGAGVKIRTKVWKLNNFCCAHRRRMETEDKAKVFTSVWAAKFVKFPAAVAV